MLFFQLLLSSTFLILNAQASFGPFGKWKVENSNSYIIYNGIYIPNPEEMVDPSSILDSLNPVSSFNSFWRNVPSFNFFGGGDTSGDDQYNNPYADQYNNPYGDQYNGDPSTISATYESPLPSGSAPMSAVVINPPSSSDLGSSGLSGLSGMFGFGGSGDDASAAPAPADDSMTYAAEGTDSSSSGLSSYLPWNWFSGNSRSGNSPGGYPIGANNQIPDEFSFLMETPFKINRRSSNISPEPESPRSDQNKEKVSVYYTPIGHGRFLQYELHEPITNENLQLNQPQQNPEQISAPAPHGMRKRRSLINSENDVNDSSNTERVSKQYFPRPLRKLIPNSNPTAASSSITKKSDPIQYNRRRYQQLQKQKKYMPSASSSRRTTLLSKFQKIKKSDESIKEVASPDKSSTATMDKDDADFPCPKVGVWSYNGELCIAIGPVPKWACKPNDLLTTGKLVVCRNKILMS